MSPLDHLMDKSIAVAEAFDTGRILGKLAADPSQVSLEELGRVRLEYVEDPEDKD